MQVFRINAVGKDGRARVLRTAEGATEALARIRDAFGEYPHAWVTDEQGHDVRLGDLVRMAEGERKGRDQL